MPKQVSLVVGAAAILAAAFAWWAFPRAGRDTGATRDTSPSAAPAQGSSTPAPNAGRRAVAAASRSVSQSLDPRPFIEVRAQLERLAEAGDAHAALRLGRTLAQCNGYVPMTDAQLEDFVVDVSAVGMSLVTSEGRQQTPEALLETLKLGFAQKRLDCRDTGGLHDADARTKALRWIERSAALGNADAQALYGSTAFSSYDARDALVDAESLREHKRRAIDYLQKSLAQGDALALFELHRSYSAGTLYPADAAAAYAHLYAYSLTPRASELAPELLERTLASHAKALDAQGLQRARDEGRRLAACCGAAAGEAP